MSALGDVAAAILPPEAGGPDPERVASVGRRMVDRMPAVSRVGLGAALVGLEAFSLARTGRRLGSVPAPRREELLTEFARIGGSPALDTVKSIVLLAHGADDFAAEIAAVGSRHEPSNPDGNLDLAPVEEWPTGASCDAVVIGSGAGGAFAARALARAGFDTVVVEEGERWSVERLRSSHPLDRAVGGTTVINSGTCYRPPAPVAAAWHERHGLALANPELLGARVADVE